MVISQGDVCWVSLPDSVGSAPGVRRPVLIVQGDSVNASRISTAAVVPLTSNEPLAVAPGNVLLPPASTGLSKDSVANVSQIVAIDRELLTERVSHPTPT
jgi:mRNA interferase MazF